MENLKISERLERIESLIQKSSTNTQKELLTIDEAAALTGFKKSYLYRLTCKRRIPFYKPAQKIFFKKSELEQWVFDCRERPINEIERSALNNLVNSRGFDREYYSSDLKEI